MPTPTVRGGLAFGPALSMVSTTKSFHRGEAVRGGEHLERAHVVAAGALDEHGELQAFARDRLVVDDGRGVVAGVGPVYGALTMDFLR
jgi:hypothetical protein